MEIVVLLVIVAFVVSVCLGYAMNIVRLSKTKVLSGMSLLRIVGIFFFPVGCVLGYVKDFV